MAQARKRNEALVKGEGNNGNTGNTEYVSDSEKKAQEKKQKAADRAAANALRKKEAEARKEDALRKKQQKQAIDAQKALTDVELVENYRRYSQGEIDLRKFREKELKIKEEGLDEQIKIYGKDSDQAKELLKKKTDLEADYNKEVTKMDEDEIQRRHAEIALDLQSALNEEGSIMYQNQEGINEALYENDLDALQQRQALYKKGSEEWLNLQADIEQMEGEHKLQNAQHYNELLAQLTEQYGNKSNEAQKKLTMNGLDWLEHYELEQLEEIYKKDAKKKEEYEQKKNEITEKYAELRKNIILQFELEQSQNDLYNSAGEKFKRNADTAYQTASNNAKADFQSKHPKGTGVKDFVSSDVTIYASTLANIKKMEQDGVVSHQEAMAAMSQATADMCQDMAAKMQAAYDAISPIMSAMSSYYSAQSDYEVSVTEKKYDKMIEKAGNNTAKSKKLEEKKQKEVAKIKTKYAKKQMKMEIAQAIAQTAMSAIAAYGSAMSGVPYPANLVLAPIAAGIALAAGAIQIAAIKKQQQAQEAGYYEGGFTGGNRYRREAGVVHEGEFVANHNAVNNPQLLPALRLIDVAQRNNTVGRLTATDVSRAMGVGGATVVSAPTVNVQTDNSELADTLQQARDTLEKLGSLIDGGITANVSMENFKKQEKHWNQIQKNK